MRDGSGGGEGGGMGMAGSMLPRAPRTSGEQSPRKVPESKRHFHAPFRHDLPLRRLLQSQNVFAIQRFRWWAHKGSNLGPLPCEGNALPLSYAPGSYRAIYGVRIRVSSSARLLGARGVGLQGADAVGERALAWQRFGGCVGYELRRASVGDRGRTSQRGR